ncbi:MAG TPA: hypothetical protein VMJ10_13520 [Kofleriaceae bacterium]|nr:hypothetical protein [Kofleriaceae bacterium]
MRPISRETIIDRKQPLLRWSAVFAGTAISIALWVLLQMLGMGVGFAAINLDDAGSLRDLGIGTTAWTCIAPMIAMFIGGLIAGRLAGTHERGIGAVHGFVVWALTSMLGIGAMLGLVSALAEGAMHGAMTMNGQPGQPPTSAELGQAASATGQILLGAGVSMLVSLATAVLGGLAGVTRRERRREGDRTVVTTVEPPPPPPTVIVAAPPAP